MRKKKATAEPRVQDTHSYGDRVGGGSGSSGTGVSILQHTRKGQHFSVSGEQGQGSSVEADPSIRMSESSAAAVASVILANEDSCSSSKISSRSDILIEPL